MWPATNGARKLADELGVDLREVAPRVPRPGAFVDTQDVRSHAQPATCQAAVPCARQPAVKKRRREAMSPEVPQKTAAGEPESSQAEDVGGDPLLVDGNWVRVTWPMEDGTRAKVGGAVRWLAERAAQGRKRVYEVVFDDGDVRWARLVGKVAFMVTGSGYKAGRLWTKREEEAMMQRRRAMPQEELASIAMSLGRSTQATIHRYRKLQDPGYAPSSGSSGIHTGVRVGWRRVVAKAMQGLTEQKGAIWEIYAAVEKLPDVIGALDTSIVSGKKSQIHWQYRILRTLNTYPEFVRISSKRSRKSAYRYDATRAQPAKSKAKGKTDKSLNYIKAFRK
eukprot:gene12856-15192_t